MKLDEVANSGNNEFYTPLYAIKPILKYIKPYSTIWCPFDTEDSLFVKTLRKEGHTVIATHINNGEDFFEIVQSNSFHKVAYDNKFSAFYKDKEIKYIISNPPYSLKGEVFETLFKLKIPFAMLVGVVGLFESNKRFTLFANNDFEMMYFDKRSAYFKDYNEQKPSLNPPFLSVYVCKDMLPKQIVFERLEKDTKQISLFEE